MFHRIKSNTNNRINAMLVLVVLFIGFSFTLHKEFYSISNIKYNEQDRTLQITMMLFTNDVELELNNHYETIMELGTKREIENADTLLISYIKRYFKIDVNKNPKIYKYIGKEFEKDVVFLYLEVTDVENIKEIKVESSILTASFPEQVNHIKVKVNQTNKSMRLTRNYSSEIAFF